MAIIFNTEYPNLTDSVTGKRPSVVLSAGRWNEYGQVFGENIAVTDNNSVHVGPGAYTEYICSTEDLTRGNVEYNDVDITPDSVIFYSGSSYWRRVFPNMGFTTNIFNNDALIQDLTDEWTFHSATFVLEGRFFTLSGWLKRKGDVSVVLFRLQTFTNGTLRILAQRAQEAVTNGLYVKEMHLTESTYPLPPVRNLNATGPLTVPLNYADADEGIKYSFADHPKLYDVLTSKGKMVVEWTPKFNVELFPININQGIVSCQNWLYSLLYLGAPSTGTPQIKVYDGTNSIYQAVPWQANTRYTITLRWGFLVDGSPKMQLIVTDGITIWESSVVDFDGSFNPDEALSLGWENTYWQKIHKIEFYDDPDSVRVFTLDSKQYNDELLSYYHNNGASSPELNCAEYEFLKAQGVSGNALPEMWEEFLKAQGYEGTLSDMMKQFGLIP